MMPKWDCGAIPQVSMTAECVTNVGLALHFTDILGLSNDAERVLRALGVVGCITSRLPIILSKSVAHIDMFHWSVCDEEHAVIESNKAL